MKTLSLKQPFAQLVVSNPKSIEIRSWNTLYRGEFLVHASLVPDKKAMVRFGFEKNSLPLGAIVGKATLTDVKHYASPKEFKKDYSKHLATSDYGLNGFILENPVRFKEPIPAKGRLGFWEYEL